MAKKKAVKKDAPKKEATNVTKVGSAKPIMYLTKRGRRTEVEGFQFGVDKTPAWFKVIDQNDYQYFETQDGGLRQVRVKDYVVKTKDRGIRSMRRSGWKARYKNA